MPIANPIAFRILNFEIRWYGLLIAFAICLALIISIKRGKTYQISEDTILDFFLYLIPIIIVGARLYYVIFEWQYYGRFPEKIVAVWEGGLAIHGGLIAGIIYTIIFTKMKNIDFFKLTDMIIISLPLCQAIGRWGNYFNGEAYGIQTNLPWALNVIDPVLGLIKVHPTFLYESICNLFLFISLLIYEKKVKRNHGEILFLYFIVYGIIRFFIEGLRTDSLMFFSLRIAQVVSIFLVLIGIVGFWYIRKANKKTYNRSRN